MQPHPLRKNLVCHFPSLSTRERGRERQGERGKREHVTMVTDSVAPRPSAKMLGHIQHPSVPAVCVCACVYRVFVCSLRCSGTPGEREPLTAKKVSHLTSLPWHVFTAHTHTPSAESLRPPPLLQDSDGDRICAHDFSGFMRVCACSSLDSLIPCSVNTLHIFYLPRKGWEQQEHLCQVVRTFFPGDADYKNITTASYTPPRFP